MSDLPEPLTPADCDLRDYVWMPLDTRRLLTSETFVLGTGDEVRAALALWCESWQQVPAGSLPDNDKMLAHLSQSAAVWKKVKDAALRNWIKCADGRLYHPVVCEKARESWAHKQAQKARTEAARLARAKKSESAVSAGGAARTTETVTQSATENVTASVAISVTEPVTGSNRPDQTRPDLKKERKKERWAAQAGVPGLSGEAAASAQAPPDLAERIASLTGRSPATARSLLGRLLKAARDRSDVVEEAIAAAERCPPADAAAWLMAAVAPPTAKPPRETTAAKLRRQMGLAAELDAQFAAPAVLQ